MGRRQDEVEGRLSTLVKVSGGRRPRQRKMKNWRKPNGNIINGSSFVACQILSDIELELSDKEVLEICCAKVSGEFGGQAWQADPVCGFDKSAVCLYFGRRRSEGRQDQAQEYEHGRGSKTPA